MPSSNKTAFLGLNNWEPGDKPKRDDFNSDNRLIDAGIQRISQGLEVLSAFSAHAESADLHCTADEKALWSKHGFVFGTYEGDSAALRKITLGYPPKLVMVFPADKPMFEAMFSSGVLYVYTAIGTPGNTAKGLRLESDGFSVVYNAAVNAGVSLRTNQSGVSYGYFVCG